MKTLVADVESDGLLPTLTKLHCIGIGDPNTDDVILYADHPDYPCLEEGYKRLEEADRVVFHNGLGFDFFAINKVRPGTLRFDQIYDTLIVSRLLDPERRTHNLEDWGVRLGHPKVAHDDWTTFSSAMALRCVEDVRITIKVLRRVWKKSQGWGESVALEHQIRLPLALQEQRGFKLDIAAARELEATLRQEQNDLEDDLDKVFPPIWVGRKKSGDGAIYPWLDDINKCVVVPKAGKITSKGPYVKDAPYCRVQYQTFNPGSRKHIEARLRKEGWKPRVFTDTGAAKLDDKVLNELAETIEVAKPLARYFRLQKQLGQLADGDNAWLKLVDDNDRVHGSVNPNGAITGRMSHFAPNLAQVDKKDLRMRAVWIADDEYLLVGVDADGLELRLLGHFLAPYDNGAFIQSILSGNKADGTDPHSINLRLLKAFDRDRGPKRFIYAMIYGAGNEKLGKILIQDAVDTGNYSPNAAPHLFKRSKSGKVIKRKAMEVGKEGRVALEKGIVGLEHLLKKVKTKHREQGWIRGLDGRRIFTRSEHSALNTLLQGAGAIVMKRALAICHFDLGVKQGFVSNTFEETIDFGYVANVHDETQNEVIPERADEFGDLFADAIRLAGEYYKLRCPMAGSKSIGHNWKETH